VDGPGTGDGFKAFCAGDTDISDASRPIKDEEAQACADAGVEYVELKVAYDGITVLTSAENPAVGG
jgi:phosphate transport system substrate-binding protein